MALSLSGRPHYHLLTSIISGHRLTLYSVVSQGRGRGIDGAARLAGKREARGGQVDGARPRAAREGEARRPHGEGGGLDQADKEGREDLLPIGSKLAVYCRCKKVYVGSYNEMDAGAVLQEASKMKAEALGYCKDDV